MTGRANFFRTFDPTSRERILIARTNEKQPLAFLNAVTSSSSPLHSPMILFQMRNIALVEVLEADFGLDELNYSDGGFGFVSTVRHQDRDTWETC